jgi:hypothetical protein
VATPAAVANVKAVAAKNNFLIVSPFLGMRADPTCVGSACEKRKLPVRRFVWKALCDDCQGTDFRLTRFSP